MIYKIIEQIMSEKEHRKYCHFRDEERFEQDVSHFRESESMIFDIVEYTLTPIQFEQWSNNYAYQDNGYQFIFDRIREIKSIDNLEDLTIHLLDEESYIRASAEIRAKEILEEEKKENHRQENSETLQSTSSQMEEEA